jgi:hypothetical protein
MKIIQRLGQNTGWHTIDGEILIWIAARNHSIRGAQDDNKDDSGKYRTERCDFDPDFDPGP